MGNFDYESGRRLLEEGELAEAIRCFLASLDVDPRPIDTYLALLHAYEAAWHESGDPMVLDQMRKVAVAGLKRDPDAHQRDTLQAGLDRADEQILAIQEAEQEWERQDRARGRRLPMLNDAGPVAPRGGSKEPE